MHPGQRNSLDALAKRYEVDASARELHGALLDARILAEVYLVMTGGQVSLSLEGQTESQRATELRIERIDRDGLTLHVRRASVEEGRAHAAWLVAGLAEQTGRSRYFGRCA